MDGSDEYICSKNHPQVLHLQVLADNVNATSVQVDWQLAHEGSEEQISRILYQPAFAPEGDYFFCLHKGFPFLFRYVNNPTTRFWSNFNK